MSPTARRLVADIRVLAAPIARSPKWPASREPNQARRRDIVVMILPWGTLTDNDMDGSYTAAIEANRQILTLPAEPEGFPLVEWCVKQTCTLQSKTAPTLLKRRYGLDISVEGGRTIWKQSHTVADHAQLWDLLHSGSSSYPMDLASSMTMVLIAAISVTSIGYSMRSHNARGKPPAKVEKALA
jgi:hypothetical protein